MVGKGPVRELERFLDRVVVVPRVRDDVPADHTARLVVEDLLVPEPRVEREE